MELIVLLTGKVQCKTYRSIYSDGAADGLQDRRILTLDLMATVSLFGPLMMCEPTVLTFRYFHQYLCTIHSMGSQSDRDRKDNSVHDYRWISPS